MPKSGITTIITTGGGSMSEPKIALVRRRTARLREGLYSELTLYQRKVLGERDTVSQAIKDLTTAAATTGSFYDRIARFYNLTFKFNRYGRSLERYLRANPLPLARGARILDAGCGTGLLTLTLLKVLDQPARISALDLSASSLATAKPAIEERLGTTGNKHRVWLTQGNVLALPFADDSFEFVVTSGVLEYVPLDDGLAELARVLAPNGHLLHLPIRPSPMGRLLEAMFHFKTHPPREVAENTNRYFRIVSHYRFPPLDPIGWSKTAVLAQKQ